MGNRDCVTALGSMAHPRRKFIDAQRVTATRKEKDSEANIAVSIVAGLFATEAGIKEKIHGEKYITRQNKS